MGMGAKQLTAVSAIGMECHCFQRRFQALPKSFVFYGNSVVNLVIAVYDRFVHQTVV